MLIVFTQKMLLAKRVKDSSDKDKVISYKYNELCSY